MHLGPWTPSTLVPSSSSFFRPIMFHFLSFEGGKSTQKKLRTNLPSSTPLWEEAAAESHLQSLTFAHRNSFALTGTHPEKKQQSLGQAEGCTECPLKRKRPSCIAPHKTTGSHQQGKKIEPKKALGGRAE